ncbi:MAG TPA: 50S ribosomal protein L1 [Thermodesulfobacteriota bacterium]|nr:50S ribosomal protein L1 [Thermodesulfobacteriota bacterium]
MAGKKYNLAKKNILEEKAYGVEEAFNILKGAGAAKFDETVDMAVRLGIDPKHPEQMIRGSVVLPHGTGKKVRILVFAKGEKEAEAKEAGADYAGGDELVEKIKGGWLDFDMAVATPDMMGLVGKLGKILGPRGLMPNPKLGTVTFDVKKAVQDLKAGKVEYRTDKAGNVHSILGKLSFGAEKLLKNFRTLMDAILKAKPPSSKGTYLKSIYVSTTMGPSIKIDAAEVRDISR